MREDVVEDGAALTPEVRDESPLDDPEAALLVAVLELPDEVLDPVLAADDDEVSAGAARVPTMPVKAIADTTPVTRRARAAG